MLNYSNKDYLDLDHFCILCSSLVHWLFQNGAAFFFLKLNFSFYWKGNATFDPISKEEAYERLKTFDIDILNSMLKQFSLSEFSYIVIDEHKDDSFNSKKGYPYLKLIFCVKNLGFLNNIEQNLNLSLVSFLKEPDFSLVYLENVNGVISMWRSLISNSTDRFFLVENIFEHHYFNIYHSNCYISRSFYSQYFDLYSSFFFFFKGAKINVSEDFRNEELINCLVSKEAILLNLWVSFMCLNEIFCHKQNLYQKDFRSKYSYNLIGDINLFTMKTAEILDNLKLQFPDQLNFVNTKVILFEDFVKSYSLIKSNCLVLPLVKFSYEFLEFKNGLFSLKTCKFSDKNLDIDNDFISKDFMYIKSIKYFDFDYKRKKPKYWILSLQKKFGDRKLVNTFLAAFSKLFSVLDFDLINNKQLFLRDLEVIFGLEKATVFFEKLGNSDNIFSNFEYFIELVRETVIVDNKTWLKIEKELPYIIIYCNSLYRKSLGYTTKIRKKAKIVKSDVFSELLS